MDYPATGTGWGTRPASYQGYATQTTAAFDPGLPFGTYSICLWDKNTSKSLQYTTNTATQYDNKDPNGRTTGSANTLINTGSGWVNGNGCA